MHRRLSFFAALLLITAGTARADVAPAPPLWSRISTTDVILVGRAATVLDQDVEAVSPYGGNDRIKYRIALVTVTDGLKDAKGLKTVRIGFIPRDPGAPKLSREPFQLKTGDEGLFFLTKHPRADFYLVHGFYDFVPAKFANFKEQTAEVKRLAGLLGDAQAGLTSKDREVRFLSAALLVSKYRQRPWADTGKPATEPLDAAESKKILHAILDGDWKKADSSFGQPAPLMLFHQLGVTAADGWMPPKVITDPSDYARAVEAWLTKHADTYRIQKLVAAK
jgi:hypothetical protein